jgi:toxin ParE1/3/4
VKIRWTPLAAGHLESAFQYLAQENETGAHQQIDRILEAVAKLAEFPQLGRGGRVEGTRELVIARTPFVVAYRIRAGQIQILSVLHGARRWPEQLE